MPIKTGGWYELTAKHVCSCGDTVNSSNPEIVCMYQVGLSLVVPCYNEDKTIYRNVKVIYQYLRSNVSSFEIIAVNDGSEDNTLQELQRVAREIPLRIITNGMNYGKGHAVKNGVMASKKEMVLFMDADLAISIEELGPFLEMACHGNDICIASRFVPGHHREQVVHWYRKAMEQIFRAMRVVIIGCRDIRDTQCGFKLFKRQAALKIFPLLTINRFAFDSEIIFLAKKRGYNITELPVAIHNLAKSHIHFIRDPLNMSMALMKIRLNNLTGKYNRE
jgi:glycosyltransferase involved in cell wall biosynthesis